MQSTIFLKDKIVNKERKFGSALEYLPAYVEDEEGQLAVALFTKNQLQDALDRAEDNPEDVEPFLSFEEEVVEEESPWFVFWRGA